MTAGGRVEVPDDLTAITTVGVEEPCPESVEPIWEAVRQWYQVGVHPAIQICLRVDGAVVLNRAIGHAWGNEPGAAPDTAKILVTPDTPYCVYSAAKGITSTVIHLLAERGLVDLEAPVCEYLPGFTSHGKHRIRVRHVLSHTAGVPFFPKGTRIEGLADPEYARDQLYSVKPIMRPGLYPIYHAITFGYLTREIVRAATGESIRDILHAEILAPLGFRWTNYGVAEADLSAVAPSHPTGPELPGPLAAAFRTAVGGSLYAIVPATNEPRFLTSVVPSSNTVSNAVELSKFYELLRCGGSLDGVRVISADSIAKAVVPQTHLLPNVAVGLKPMRWGLGYMLSSDRFGPFGRDSGGAFGHTGLVNIASWTDPRRRLSGAIVSSGKPGPHKGEDRYPAVFDVITRTFPRS